MTTLFDVTNTLKHDKPSSKQSQARASQHGSQRASRLQSQNVQRANDENLVGSRERTQGRYSQNGGSRAIVQSRNAPVSQTGSRGLVQNRDTLNSGLNQPFIVPTPKSQHALGTPISNKSLTKAGPTRGTQRSRPSVVEENEEELVEEDDDDYYDDDEDSQHYYPDWLPEETAEGPLGPRVQTSDGYEECSCFPNRTSKKVSSMLYENVKCVHTGLQGHTHAGVFRFNDNWIDSNEVPIPRDAHSPPKIKYVFGYPKPIFVNEDTDDEYDDDDDDVDDFGDEKPGTSSKKKDDGKKTKSASKEKDKNEKQGKSKGSAKLEQKDAKKNDVTVYDDEDEDDEDIELARDDRYYPIILPQIGHSPPPSRENSRMSSRSVPALPPLPESPFLINEKKTSQQSKKRSISSRENDRRSAPLRDRNPGAKREIDTTRRFQGKYYDPVTKKAIDYDITPMFRKRPRDWDAQGTGRSRMSSRMPDRMSNFGRNSSVGIPEEDDGVY